jgi:membrane associated rhomboid family serine protease
MQGHLSVTLILIVINVAFSFAAFNQQALKNRFMFNPYMVKHRNEWWRLFTGGFLHADMMHLAFNMFTLYSFGNLVEGAAFVQLFEAKAPLYFAGLYIGGLLFADIYALEKHKNDIWYNALGASGAVSAVVFSSILMMPTQVEIFGLPSFVYGILYIIYSVYAGNRGKDNIGHGAHLGGAVFGLIYTFIVYPEVGQMFIYHVQSALGNY